MKSVLVIDDELQICESINMILEYEGYAVDFTTSANEGLEKFSTKDFSAVLLDIQMPEMDGYAALKEIRKTNTSVPVVAFTAGVFDNIKQKMEDAGFEGFIRKPFKPDELSSKILEFTAVTA